MEEEPLEESTPEVTEPEENAETTDDGNTPADSGDTSVPFSEESLNGSAASDPLPENNTGDLSVPTAEIPPTPAPQPPQ